MSMTCSEHDPNAIIRNLVEFKKKKFKKRKRDKNVISKRWL